MANSSGTQWIDQAHKLGKDLRKRAAEHDHKDLCYEASAKSLRQHGHPPSYPLDAIIPDCPLVTRLSHLFKYKCQVWKMSELRLI